MGNVYFTKENNKILELLEKTGIAKIIQPNDFTAIKLHFGEKGNLGFIKPENIKPIIKKVKELNAKPFLTDANTIYVGKRADAVNHLSVAEEHGFTLQECGCPVIIADGLRGNSFVDVNVELKHFKKVKIANAVYYSDSIIFASHFKGHEITSFGGALKNIGMGCASRAGKYEMHDSVIPKVDISKCNGCGVCIKWCGGNALILKENKIFLEPEKCIGCGECILSCSFKVFRIPWDESVKNVQEKMIEYVYGALKNKRYFCINFINFLTKHCDCYETKEEPLMDNIGIVASVDPVAVDQASVDIVNKKYGKDLFKEIWTEIDYNIQLDYAQELGIGSRQYKLIDL